MRITCSQTKLLLCAAFFFTLVDNTAFFVHVFEAYPITLKNVGFLSSLALGLMATIMLLLSLVASTHTTKPVLILLLLLSSAAAYFMNHYNLVIDRNMVRSILQTNWAEASDLVTFKLIAYLLLLGALPAFLVYRTKLTPLSWKSAVVVKLRDSAICILVIFALVLAFSRFYSSFFREHKPLRSYTNPVFFLYSVGKYVKKDILAIKAPVAPLGLDARIENCPASPKLVILVVGEAVRADRLSLNGYQRETTPLLRQEGVFSLTNVHSCDTSTALSLPCMFSSLTRTEFSERKAAATENLLDVLTHAGVHVLWRDNNSDSKGTAVRVTYEDYRLRANNPICDDECRDVGMLIGLQDYIDAVQQGDNILIVLHQMGNHGPAYYKRYPPPFAQFTPVCSSSQLDECTPEEISNSYDNALLYTDYFLAQVISLLKDNSSKFETAMVYMSDHGESLGEYGIYLHGLPYLVAPESQKRIAALLWLSDHFRIDRNFLQEIVSTPFSHDNLFHTILGLMDVRTDVYDEKLDMLAEAEKHHLPSAGSSGQNCFDTVSR